MPAAGSQPSNPFHTASSGSFSASTALAPGELCGTGEVVLGGEPMLGTGGLGGSGAPGGWSRPMPSPVAKSRLIWWTFFAARSGSRT
jgi:hypothetical protein